MSIIDLAARFGQGEDVGDITKRRKSGDGKPDSGLDWRAYNASTDGTKKDSRGRWTDNPVGRAIAQAFSNARAKGNSHSGSQTDDMVHLSDIRDELGDQFTREEVDAELKRLGRASAAGGDPDVHLWPQSNQKILTDEQRAGAIFWGDQDKHLLRMTGQLPAPKVDPARKYEALRDPTNFDRRTPAEQMDRARKQTIAMLDETSQGGLDEWDDADLAALRAHTATLMAAIDGEQKRRKAAAKPRATARLTSSRAPVDTAALAAELRALPADAASLAGAKERLGALTIPQLRELAGKTGFKLPSKGRKQELADRMAGNLVGFHGNTDSDTSKPNFPGSAAHTAQLLRDLPVEHASEAKAREIIGRLTVPQIKEVADELGVTLSGRSKLDLQNSLFHRSVGRRVNSAAIAGYGKDDAAVDAPTGADLAARLRAIPGTASAAEVEELRAELNRLTVPELKALAKDLGPTVHARGAKGQLVDGIMEGTVGFRQRSQAINPGGVARRESGGDEGKA